MLPVVWFSWLALAGCADDVDNVALPSSPFTCEAEGREPFDTDAVPDLGDELGSDEILTGWTTSFRDGGDDETASTGPSLWWRVGENGGGAAELFVASYGTADEPAVWFEHLAAVAIAFKGLSAFETRDAESAAAFVRRGEVAGYTWIEEASLDLDVERACIFVGPSNGSVGEGTIEKWCVSIDGTYVGDVDPGISVEWCDDPALCGGEGLLFRFDGASTGEWPAMEYVPEGGVYGAYLRLGRDDMPPGLSAMQLAALGTRTLVADDLVDSPCLWYPDGGEAADDDGDGFLWYASVQAETW